MTLKTLGRTRWKKIKIGEVFAWRFNYCGTWAVEIKISKDGESFCLSEYTENVDFTGENNNWDINAKRLYKLPRWQQNLWRTP